MKTSSNSTLLKTEHAQLISPLMWHKSWPHSKKYCSCSLLSVNTRVTLTICIRYRAQRTLQNTWDNMIFVRIWCCLPAFLHPETHHSGADRWSTSFNMAYEANIATWPVIGGVLVCVCVCVFVCLCVCVSGKCAWALVHMCKLCASWFNPTILNPCCLECASVHIKPSYMHLCWSEQMAPVTLAEVTQCHW